MKQYRLAVWALPALLVPLTLLAAGIFSDVGPEYPYKAEIDSLSRAGVIGGNPDGTFRPEKLLNRAEFLKMLYVSMNRQPKNIYAGCFPDVESGSWYELYVCDAAARENGYVRGYGDGTFHPSSPVTRTEALKMMFMVLGLNAPDISESDRGIIKFVDVSVSAWYSRYVSAAYASGILPITGQSGTRFYPDQALTRGEAAAVLWNGLRVLDEQRRQASLSSSLAVSSSSAGSEYIVKEVSFPFSDNDKFPKLRPVSYVFIVPAKTVVSVKAQLTTSSSAGMNCRLYLLDAQGFSDEYYLGFEQPGQCTINAMVRPGKYQLQLQPSIADASFQVVAGEGTGDGNDGFADAVLMLRSQAKTGLLDINDLSDWYTFSVEQTTTATVEVSGSDNVKCTVYLPASFDQYGFAGPECGKPFQYEPGDPFLIGIQRLTDPMKKVTYTVKWE